MSVRSPTIAGGRLTQAAFVSIGIAAGLSICGYFWRCLHLLKNDHYYILSPDSYFFHWQAQRVLLNEDIPMKLHSGLTYPLVYAAKAISSVFGMPETDALTWSGLLLPPLFGVLSILLLYFFVSRMYSKRVALFSAIVWSVALIPVFMFAAGYLDRDGLSVLLVMVGVMTFYLSRDWHFRVGGVDVGTLGGIVSVLAVEALLYVEWLYIGPLIMMVILIAFWGTEVVMSLGRRLFSMMMKSEADIVQTGMDWLQLIPSTLWRSNWRSLSVLLGVNLVAVIAVGPGLTEVYSTFIGISLSSVLGAASVQELQGMTLVDVQSYQLFTIPAILGIFIALKNGRRADCLFLGWFVCLFVLGLFAKRFLLFAAPAICVLAGIGFGYLLDLRGIRCSRAEIAGALSYDTRLLGRYAMFGLGVVVLLVSLAISIPNSYNVGSHGLYAANKDWEAGLAWLRDNTSQDAVVLSHWTHGYFILDLADRRPVVDNGYYGWDEERNRDVSTIYCTTEAAEAVSMMQKYGADYLVMSDVEVALLPRMTAEALGESYGNGTSIPREIRGSIYARAMSGELVSEGGLARVYPEDPAVSHPPFVVLALDSE